MKVVPVPKATAQHIVDGYIKMNATNIIIPYDINKICFIYYNDVCYWSFNVAERSDHDTVDEDHTTIENADAISDDFEIMGIKYNYRFYQNMKMDLQPVTHAVLYVMVYLPSNVESVHLYIEASEPTIDAQ